MNKFALYAGAGVIGITVVAAALGLGWAIVHGLCELVTWAFGAGWEPTWYQTLAILLVFEVAIGAIKNNRGR